ncbi:hypothetical protein EV401DRAFT_2053550 [Pisolithus croceorrhizus]|nr:hypothetical protein EV401DRAFT_2053550 [Pisolithus croceorrhizus]
MSNPSSNTPSYNNNLRLEERTRFFNSVGRGPDDVARLKKLAEGGFNCTFVITVHDGCRMVTRIPYSVTVPKPFDIASEVATMTFLRFRGLPIPEVFDYPPKPDNTAGTEYIFMAYVNDDSLDNIYLKTLPAGNASEPGVLLEDDKSFCVGPDTSAPLWYGRRSELDLDRGPCRPLPPFFANTPLR